MSEMNNTHKNLLQVIRLQVWMLFADAILINIGFLSAFLIKHRLLLPEHNFAPYRKSFPFLTVIFLLSLSLFKVYKNRFKSSGDLFKRICAGLFFGTLLSIAFVYVFRNSWGGFPTSVFIISFLVNLFLIYKITRHVLKAKKRIKKYIVILGEGKVDDIFTKKACVERKRIDHIQDLLKYSELDEIVISEKITNANDLNLLLFLEQKLKAEILFSPLVYIELLPERINGNSSVNPLSTFVGKLSDVDEFLIRALDIAGSLGMLLLISPAAFLISLLIKLTSPGPVFYAQKRTGKDGKIFTLYKFRTMVENAENLSGFAPATNSDPRVTKIGRVLRPTRLDELPQLFNILRGDMSLVGPRPENLYRVAKHKALQGLRLAVKPGLTGLAQIRSFYDLKPKHKIKYDYLYIQRRTLLLNIYILLQTIRVVLSKKGW
jgi:lipopolysaccharide/colanic/teichoic acid biosynthesis glycosyltransferase